MYFIPVGEKFGHNPRHVMEDAYDGLYQLAHNPLLLIAFCGTAISIAFFNFAGRGGIRIFYEAGEPDKNRFLEENEAYETENPDFRKKIENLSLKIRFCPVFRSIQNKVSS